MAADLPSAANSAPLAAASPSLPPRGGVRLRALVLIRWAAVAGQVFTAAVVHWGLNFTLPLLAVGGVATVAYVIHARRCPAPILDLSLLTLPTSIVLSTELPCRLRSRASLMTADPPQLCPKRITRAFRLSSRESRPYCGRR